MVIPAAGHALYPGDRPGAARRPVYHRVMDELAHPVRPAADGGIDPACLYPDADEWRLRIMAQVINLEFYAFRPGLNGGR